MHSISTIGATGAPTPSPETLRRARILARVGVSASVAGVLAGLAFPTDGRDSGAQLVAVTASRIEGVARG